MSQVKKHVFDCLAASAGSKASVQENEAKASKAKVTENPSKASDTSNESKADGMKNKHMTNKETTKIVIKRTPSRKTWHVESPKKDNNHDSTVANRQKRKRGAPSSMDENAPLSKAKKSRHSNEPEKSDADIKQRSSKEMCGNGDPKTELMRNRSDHHVNKEGHVVPNLTERQRPQREVWSLRKEQQEQKSTSGHPNHPKRSSARSAEKKISNIIKDIIERDEDGLRKDKEHSLSKQTDDEKMKISNEPPKVKDDPKELPKNANAPLTHKASPTVEFPARRDAMLKERRVLKERAANPIESDAKAGKKYKNPLHVSVAKTSSEEEKQRTYEKMTKVAIKKEREDKEQEKSEADKILELKTPPASNLKKLLPATATSKREDSHMTSTEGGGERIVQKQDSLGSKVGEILIGGLGVGVQEM